MNINKFLTVLVSYILTKDLSCCPEEGVFTAGGCEGIWGLKGGVSGVFNISSRKLAL